MVEPRVVVPVVAGSSPVRHPRESPGNGAFASLEPASERAETARLATVWHASRPVVSVTAAAGYAPRVNASPDNRTRDDRQVRGIGRGMPALKEEARPPATVGVGRDEALTFGKFCQRIHHAQSRIRRRCAALRIECCSHDSFSERRHRGRQRVDGRSESALPDSCCQTAALSPWSIWTAAKPSACAGAMSEAAESPITSGRVNRTGAAYLAEDRIRYSSRRPLAPPLPHVALLNIAASGST